MLIFILKEKTQKYLGGGGAPRAIQPIARPRVKFYSNRIKINLLFKSFRI